MVTLIEEKNRKLGQHLRELGIRYGEPFVVMHSNGDNRYVSHSYLRDRSCHPLYLIDVFCYYGSKLPNEYDNTLQLYDTDGSKYTNQIPFTRSPAWVSTPADRIRVDQFLFTIRDNILRGNLKVIPISHGGKNNWIGKMFSIFSFKKDKLGKIIKV